MWVRSLGWEDPLEEKWQPTPVFLPGKFHEQRSPMDYTHTPCGQSRTRLSTANMRDMTHMIITEWKSNIETKLHCTI